MANYQSTQRRFNKPTSSINHGYIDATLKQKQNTIDTNYGVAAQSIEKVLGQDLIREKDREYLKETLKGVMFDLSQTDAIRFDSEKARFSIQTALDKAAKDPEVLKQVANTKRFKQIQEFQKQRQKKGDLNQQNFIYAYNKSGANEYLNGTSDELGSFNYLEYVDVDAKMDEAARKLKAASPNELVSIQDPMTGKTISKKVSMITPEEMRSYLQVQLNANDLKQLEIDGSMMYGMDDQAAIQYRDRLISDSNSKYDNQISTLEKWKNSGKKTPGQIAEIDSQISRLRTQKSSFERGLIGQRTAESIGGRQLMQNKLDLYSKLYTKNGPESVKYDSSALKKMRDANSRANLKESGSAVSTITVPTNLPDTIDPYRDSLNRIDRTLKDNSQYLTNQFNSLGETDKELIQDTMEQIKNDPDFIEAYKGQPISNEILQLETLNRLGANFFPPDVAKELRFRVSQNKAIQDGIDNTTSEFVKVQLQKDENTFDQLFKEETNLTMVTPEGDVNIQKFLKDNNVSNYESFKSFISGESKEAKQLRATLAIQSMSLTNDIGLSDVGLVPGTILPTPVLTSGIGATNKIDLSESEYRIMRQSVHDISDESLDETYDIQKTESGYTLNLKNPNTNLARIIGRTNQLYQEGRSGTPGRVLLESFGVDIDRTARNESSLRGLFASDEYSDFARENMRFIDKTVAGSNSIRIQGDKKQEVDPLYQEVLQYVDNATFDKRKPIDLYKTDNGEIIVTQTVENIDAITNDEAKSTRKTRVGRIQANDVKKMNLFNSQIDMMQSESSLTTLEDINEPVKNMNFIREDRSQIEGLNRLYDRNNRSENVFRLMSSEKDARKLIFNSSVLPYLQRDSRGVDIINEFEDFAINTQNYSLDFTKGVDSDYQVNIKNKEGNTIGSIPLNKDIPTNVFEKVFYGTPQAFLSMYSKSKVDQLMKELINERR